MSWKVIKPGSVYPRSKPRFLLIVFMLFIGATFMLRYFVFVLWFLVVLVRLSVPVQVIDWKDSSPK